MLNRIIIKLIMCKLGLKNGECFRFANQNNKKCFYRFESGELMKYFGKKKKCKSEVSLNFLLSDQCKIIKGELYGYDI